MPVRVQPNENQMAFSEREVGAEPDLLKNLIWRVCISMGCGLAYFSKNLGFF